MKPIEQIEEVVIVGGGPVGNLSAVLAGLMGVKTTVYEKRQTYTRQINIKIQTGLLNDISKTFQRIIRKKDDFFDKMHELLVQKDGKIMLKTLQKNLKDKAEQLGVKYIFGKQIKTFKQVQDLHTKKSIILDCSGRNSFLRINQFGTDAQNMKIHDLHHALHINFNTVIPRQFDYRLIYSIITNSDDLKLGDIVVSKSKQEKDKNNKKVHVTIPLFISEKLSKVFDISYPNINRVPLKPFSLKKQDQILQEEVQNLLYSIFCPFLMEDWDIDWNSVLVKKINITCGYAVNRSKNRYICLGDSAAHFAYFKSLNFGLKHSFQFMKQLSSYHGFHCNLGEFKQNQSIETCKSSYPPLLIKQATPGTSPSQYYIKTYAIIYSAMVFNVAYNYIKKLDILPIFSEQKVQRLWNQYAIQVKSLPWQDSLEKFQKIRNQDIDQMILSNRAKRQGTQLVSYIVWLDGLNPLKFADVLNIATKGFTIDKKDLQYFSQTLKLLKLKLLDKQKFRQELIKSIIQIQKMVSSSIPKQFYQLCNNLKKLSQNKDFTMKELSNIISGIKWQRANYDYKRGTIFIKVIQLIYKIYQLSQKEANQIKK